MADFWQWKGETGSGAGFVYPAKGTASAVITVTLTATLTADTSYTSAETLIYANSVLIQTVLGTAGDTAKTDIAGALSSSGTMIAIIDKDTSAQMTTGLLTGSATLIFTGLPNYVGFTTTLSAGMTAGSSVTVSILPISL